MSKRLGNLLFIGVLMGIAACTSGTPSLPTAIIQPLLVSPTPPAESLVMETLPPPQTAAVQPTFTQPVILEKMSHEDWFYNSPDGQWTVQVSAAFPVTAEGSISGENYRVSLSVFRADGGLRWKILDEERPFGLGYTLPAQFHWQRDGSGLFYTEHGIPDGSPTILGFDCGLFRTDLQNGETTQLTAACGSLRAAPDGESFAALQGGRLLIHRISGEVIREISFTDFLGLGEQSGWLAGGLVWSPDNGRLAFSILQNMADAAEIQTSFVLVDLVTGSVRFFLQNQPGQYLPIDWQESEVLVIMDTFGLRYRLNIRTGEIVPAG